MNINEIMTKEVKYLKPTDTIKYAAQCMQADYGFLPIGENDRLIGAVTDRDIVLRAVAEGKDCETAVRDVMSEHIQYCFDTDSIETAAAKMEKLQIRRLVVLNKEKRLVGIVSLGDIATKCSDQSLVSKLAVEVSA